MHAHGLSRSRVEMVIRNNLPCGPGMQSSYYLAWMAEHASPVGHCGITHFIEDDFSLLRSAGVAPECRRQGVYSAMVGARIKAAKQRNISRVIVQATQSGSMPALVKLGFRVVCDMALYEFSPDGH